MKRVNNQSSFTTTCMPSDTGTSYQQRKRALVLCLALCTPGLSHFTSAQEPTFTTFDPPGSVTTFSSSINPAGAITGVYEDAGFVTHGFLRAPDGAITRFDPPGKLLNSVAINPEGAITGSYVDATFVTHGFLRAPDGTFTTIDPPDSVDQTPSALLFSWVKGLRVPRSRS